MDANKKQRPIRVVMSPWLAYGHIAPYLELARRLVSRGFIIHLCSTPATLTSIQKNIAEKSSHSIRLVPLLLPDLPGLPRDLHTTNGLPPHLMPKLQQAFMAVQDFSDILAELKPDLIIYDIFQPWAPPAAEEHNIPAVHFVTAGSVSTCFMLHHLNSPDVEFPFPEIYHREYESSNTRGLSEYAANPKLKDAIFRDVRMSREIVLIRGFKDDIDGKYIDYLTSIVGRKFVSVGPLVQTLRTDEKDNKSLDIMSWLDKKEDKSTVFVSFGSECFLSKEDMDEIACGLELSKVNFIWVVRFPNVSCNGLLPENTLPKGFVGRVGERGKILEGWAPQARILGHPSIGGFLSHCGWSSVMESVSLGVPIIAVPMQFDQPHNARLMEKIGVGVEVLRDKNERLRREALAAVIKQVVVEDHGGLVRQRAAEMREKLTMSGGDEEIDQVVEELIGLCNKNSTKNI